MNLVLHPRAAPADRLRLWLGAFQAMAEPALRWFLDGVEAVPTTLRQIRSVRPDALLPSNPPPGEQERIFAGVYYEEQKRRPLTGAYHCPHEL